MDFKTSSIRIDPKEIQKGTKAQGAPVAKGFDEFLDAAGAMEPFGAELTYQATGNDTAAAVLHGAFTGVTGAAGAYGYGGGGGAAAAGAGFGTGYGGYGALSEYPGMMGTGKYTSATGLTGSSGTLPGDPSIYTGDMIAAMNRSNLKLLELQAVMQSNMQGWNTKSNVLSADHRARMAMIEKFTARA